MNKTDPGNEKEQDVAPTDLNSVETGLVDGLTVVVDDLVGSDAPPRHGIGRAILENASFMVGFLVIAVIVCILALSIILFLNA